MKRIIHIAAILLCLVLCSCNLDGESGLYSNVAASTINTDVNVKSYLGYFSAEDNYYYLSDEGLFTYNATSRETNAIVRNSEGDILRSAYLNETSGDFYYLTSAKKIIDKSGTTIKENVKNLTTNGLLYDETNLYQVGNDTPILSSIDIQYFRVNDNYTFVCGIDPTDATSTMTYYIVDSTNTATIPRYVSTSDRVNIYCGFQSVDATTFILLAYNESTANFDLYKAVAAGTDLTITSLSKTINSSPSFKYVEQTPSFMYNDGTLNHVVFKTSSYFDDFSFADLNDATEKKVTSIKNGYATTLRTADVVNISKDAKNVGCFIAGTFSSSLYRVDPIANEVGVSTQLK